MTSLSLGYNTLLVKSIKSIFLLVLILLVRKPLNLKGTKRSNMLLWGMFFVLLLVPRTLLISVEDLSDYGFLQVIMRAMMQLRAVVRRLELELEGTLSMINRSFVAGLMLIYIIRQVIKINHVLKHSTPLVPDERMEDCLRQFPLKRKVDLLLNDDVSGPMTYGILRPKVILQSRILEDDELLHYVLFHELTHIANWDMVWTHVKNLVVCLHWFNPLVWIAAKYLEDDLEMRCDKLVLDKVGGTVAHRQAYCRAMFQLAEHEKVRREPVLNLHPTIERMSTVKRWMPSIGGTMICVLALLVATTAFAEVRVINQDPVSCVTGMQASKVEGEKDRVTALTKDEYRELIACNQEPMAKQLSHVRETRILEKYDRDQLWKNDRVNYTVEMASPGDIDYCGFVVKMSEAFPVSSICYAIIIEKDGQVVYQKSFVEGMILAVQANANSCYQVTIINQCSRSLLYTMEIHSYGR